MYVHSKVILDTHTKKKKKYIRKTTTTYNGCCFCNIYIYLCVILTYQQDHDQSIEVKISVLHEISPTLLQAIYNIQDETGIPGQSANSLNYDHWTVNLAAKGSSPGCNRMKNSFSSLSMLVQTQHCLSGLHAHSMH